MLRKLQTLMASILFLPVVLLAFPGESTWTSNDNGYLLNDGNWSNEVPYDGFIAYFDNFYNNHIYLNPYAPYPGYTPTRFIYFNPACFYFVNSASAFKFSLGNNVVLTFTGYGSYGGIVGYNNNTNIVARNYHNYDGPYAQIVFDPGYYYGTSMGSSSLRAINDNGGLFDDDFQVAQIMLNNLYFEGPYGLTYAGDNASLTVINTNNSTITSYGYDTAQIFLGGNNFGFAEYPDLPSNISITAINSVHSLIEGGGPTAQLVFNAQNVYNRYPDSDLPFPYEGVLFSVGNNAKYTFINDASIINGLGLEEDATNDTAQIIVTTRSGGPNGGRLSMSASDNFSLTISNQNGASIKGSLYSNESDGSPDVGQLVIDASAEERRGASATFAFRDNGNVVIKNTGASSITGLDYNAGQLILDGDGGGAGLYCRNGNAVTITNDEGSTIEGGLNAIHAGQFIMDADGGIASFAMGDNNVINVYNDGIITMDGLGYPSDNFPSMAAQIIMDGSDSEYGGPFGAVEVVSLGSNSIITATNGPNGVITSASEMPAAQIIVNSALLFSEFDYYDGGCLTLQAINQYPGPGLGPVKGILFSGDSFAYSVNIALVNASLVVDTENPLVIGSLTGDATSVGELSQELIINILPGVIANFKGSIYDVTGVNSLLIDGFPNGTQILSGDSTYGGGTTVREGNLQVDGSIINNVLVNGGELSGTGTAGTTLLSVTSGLLKPGNSPGILTTGGDYNQTGGILGIDIAGQGNVPGTNNGELVVGDSGSATDNVDIVVNSEDGAFFIGGAYRIVHCGGTFTGNYNPVVTTIGTTLVPVVTYDNSNVYLDFRPSFLACALDENGQNVAEQLFSISMPDPEETLLLNAITTLDCPDIGIALDDLSGWQYAQLLLANELSTRQFVRRLFDPLRQFLARDLCCCWDCCYTPTVDAWFEAGGLQNNFRKKHFHDGEGRGSRHGLRNNGYQITGGAQVESDNTWVAGAALTYEHTTTKFHHHSDANTKTVIGGLYGAYRMNECYLLGDLVFGGSESKVHRQFFVNDLFFDQHGKPEALQGILYVEGGMNFRCNSFLLQPFLGLEGGYYDYKHIRERDFDIAALEFKSRSYGTFDTRLGVHLVFDNTACSGLFVGVDLAWQHRWNQRNDFLQVEFIDFGGPFHVHGASIKDDSFDAAVNIEQKICNNWSIYATAFWQQWSNSYAYDILGGISFNW